MCSGLIGLICGHNYKAIYDVDEEQRTPEEMRVIVEAVKEHNFWASYTNVIQPKIHEPKRITRVYKGHICLRCGDRKIDESLRI